MKSLFTNILFIINACGSKLKISLLGNIVLGTILESLSIGLMLPMVVLLSKGTSIYTHRIFILFTNITGVHSYYVFIFWVLAGITSVYFIKTLFLAFITKRQNKFVFDMEAKVSEKLLEIYLAQSYSFHIHRNSSQLIKNIFNEVKLFSNTFNQALTLFAETLVISLLALILFYFQPLATFSAFLFLGLVIITFMRSLRKKIKAWGEDRKSFDADRVKTLSNLLVNIKEIKLYGHSAKFLIDYKELNQPAANAAMKHATFLKLPSIWLEFLAVLGLTVLIGAMILHGNTLLSILPLLGLFTAAMFRIMPSLNRISAAYQTIRFNRPVISSIYKELRDLPRQEDTPGKENYTFSTAIELQHISFAYAGNSPKVIKDISLTIRKGDFIGIIGKSGSGKSTLIDLITGLLTPAEGSIFIDGKKLGEEVRNWQNQIGYVPQTINLMDDTIRRNIAFGIPDNDIREDLLQNAIEEAQIDQFIHSLPAGLETMAGEKGIRMSGGQRQRIGIARALYHQPEVLVLDEATSSLDTGAEAGIMESIHRLKGRKTIIMITHKSALINTCDAVYEVKNGVLSLKQI